MRKINFFLKTIGFIFGITLFFFLFLSPPSSYADELYFSGNLPIGWAPCGSCPALPSSSTCANGSSVGTSVGSCGWSACTGGDPWSKYSLYSSSVCYSNGGPFCMWAFQLDTNVCSLGDKCTAVQPYLNYGYPECSTGACIVGTEYKTCCAGSNLGGSCDTLNYDNIPPPEGSCPSGSTPVMCPQSDQPGFCANLGYANNQQIGSTGIWCTDTACGQNACQAAFPQSTPVPTTGTIQGLRVVMPGYQTINPAQSASIALDNTICPTDINGNNGNCAVPEPNPYYFFNVTSGSHYVNVNNVPSGWGLRHADCPSGGASCVDLTTTDSSGGDNFNVPAGGAINPWWLYYPPPTASITGPTSLTVGQSGTYTGTANDANSSLSKGQIYWAPTTANLSLASSWTQMGLDRTLSGSTGTIIRSNSWATAGTYYVTVNAYNSFGGQCTGNPVITAGWANCGTDDVVTVTVTAAAPTPTLTPTPTPTPAGPTPTCPAGQVNPHNACSGTSCVSTAGCGTNSCTTSPNSCAIATPTPTSAPTCSNGTISGTVFIDDNWNGIQDPGEPGASGTTIQLYNSQTASFYPNASSDSSGNYQFTGLSTLSGINYYQINFFPPGVYQFTTPSRNGTRYNLPPCDIIVNMGISILPSPTSPPPPAGPLIDGTVYIDDGRNGGTANNGIYEVGQEIGYNSQGVSVIYIRRLDNTIIASLGTDPVGYFTQTVTHDQNYSVEFWNIPSGYQMSPGDPSSSKSVWVGSNPVTVYFGIVLTPTPTPTPTPVTYSISGDVFNDPNGNGIKDAGETNYGTAALTLRTGSCTGTLIGSTTSASSSPGYTFSGLTNGTTYYVILTRPSGYNITTPSATLCSGSNYYVTRKIESVNVNLHWGLIPVTTPTSAPGPTNTPTPTPSLSTINGTVFIDTISPNDIQDCSGACDNGPGDELGYNGASLSRTGGVNTTTAGFGTYTFSNLANGPYQITLSAISGYQIISINPSSSRSVPPNYTYNFAIRPISTPTPTPTPGGSIYTISGSVFLDDDADGIKDAGEANYTGGITIGTSDGIVSYPGGQSSGNYNLANLLAGSYIISHSPPFGFYPTLPTGAPPFFKVDVGPGNSCAVGGSLNASCVNGNIINLHFGITNSIPWIQSVGADIRFDNGFTDDIPASTACPGGSYASIVPSGGGSPGVIFGSSLDFGGGSASPLPYNWQVTGSLYFGVLSTAYGAMISTISQAGLTPTDLSLTCNLSSCTLPVGFANGLYRADGNLSLNAYTFQGNRNYVILVNGNLNINDNLSVNSGSTVTFIVKGNINVGSSVTQIAGYYSTDRSFYTGGNNNCGIGADFQLVIQGAVIVNAVTANSGAFVNQRDLCTGNSCPAVSVIIRPDFVLYAPALITPSNSLRQEVAP